MSRRDLTPGDLLDEAKAMSPKGVVIFALDPDGGLGHVISKEVDMLALFKIREILSLEIMGVITQGTITMHGGASGKEGDTH